MGRKNKKKRQQRQALAAAAAKAKEDSPVARSRAVAQPALRSASAPAANVSFAIGKGAGAKRVSVQTVRKAVATVKEFELEEGHPPVALLSKLSLREDDPCYHGMAGGPWRGVEDVPHTVGAALYGAVTFIDGDRGCFHGSTKEAFENDEWGGFLIAYLNLYANIDSLASRDQVHISDWWQLHYGAFQMAYAPILTDEDFCKFVFALCAEAFLQMKERSDNDTISINGNTRALVTLALDMRYCIIPKSRGEGTGPGMESGYFEKNVKYQRDIITDRGFVKVLARETGNRNSGCTCMESDKKEAASSDKLAHCFNCNGQFPKETMFQCTGCHIPHYCSTECQFEHWSDHKKVCLTVSKGKAKSQKERDADDARSSIFLNVCVEEGSKARRHGKSDKESPKKCNK